ncbi:trypsin-like peptidase domain-containing protein [Streptomyces scabiei]|nr:trypsin-like peptidase domain-containing protein [Streptomyces scabiei]MDX2574417.1 trypsin-like peptidase domain-containing protein [Streptomyces scabiei]MDX2653726.1 trypsin-like peptidase domain-containing protein [Streptomyces scabiei]MDX2721905.1 trypsin-like peptidase domain-containing protein [Streptomyces scabiei]MDX2865449.1 trypsin-like peptidase domain-containing protein [Streptomyces scabiei]MDX2884167.1 trypsin-like peptidase domain-containing protein [Streptomyces scabiei]
MALAPPSTRSLLLASKVNGILLSHATGFTVVADGQPFLITNWHVVSGRNPQTGQPMAKSAAIPDVLTIRHLTKVTSTEVAWNDFDEPLVDDSDSPMWFEHPEYGRKVDVVALPLTNLQGVHIQPYGPEVMQKTLRAGISDWVNIIGFPFGQAAGGSLPIWTKGAIASEPDVDYDLLPCFLIDARTRQGQSGSPVLAYSPGGATELTDGKTGFVTGPVGNLLGVYSGRINSESDIGRVWKFDVVPEILNARHRGDNSLRGSSV